MDAETGKIAANYQYGAWGEKTSVKTAEGYGELGTDENITLSPGTVLQRTGPLAGRFVAPAYTPTQMLALPPNQIGQKTTYLLVSKPIKASGGTVSPWFNQIGCGTQYKLGTSVQNLIDDGAIME